MSVAVPSQVRELIEREFPTIVKGAAFPSNQAIAMTDTACASLRALTALIDRIPAPLMPADRKDFALAVTSAEYIKSFVERSEHLDFAVASSIGNILMVGTGGMNPVRLIYDAFLNCLDDELSGASRELIFLKDLDVRKEILSDLISARSALLNSEWKPATVVAGAVAEALLLWATDQRVGDLTVACATAAAQGTDKRSLSRDRESWGLQELIAVVQALALIEQDTAAQLKIAQDFRNLIHPGRSRRKSKRCDRGTALAANAAVELLARDLQAKFLP